MKFPTLEEVEKADRLQLCKWQRFLPVSSNEYERSINGRIYDRFCAAGGMTPEISKKIGFKR